MVDMQYGISTFWRRWMMVVTLSMVMMGLVMVFVPTVFQPLQASYYNNYFDYNAYSTISDEDYRFQIFLYGVSGAVLASWALVMFFLVRFPLSQGHKWAWFAIALSLIVWFIGDGYASIATGFVVHVALNLSMLIMIGIPLLATYRQVN